MRASDAYATGSAPTALQMGAGIPVTEAVYRRGVAYLLRTQLDDGSWLVKSHSFPVQLYYETGFPHGRNQFISSAATGWAATALDICLRRTTLWTRICPSQGGLEVRQMKYRIAPIRYANQTWPTVNRSTRLPLECESINSLTKRLIRNRGAKEGSRHLIMMATRSTSTTPYSLSHFIRPRASQSSAERESSARPRRPPPDPDQPSRGQSQISRRPSFGPDES